MAELEVLPDAAVLIEGDRIAAVGRYGDLRRETHDVQRGGEVVDVVEVAGVLFPGFVDCHTHAVFGAPRLDDHQRRALGEDYKTIAARGGGILQSVNDVRARSEADLAALARARITALLAHGSTTIEVKSGYGLALDAELKQLRVVRQLQGTQPATLVPTFLGAHEVPPELRERRAEYVRQLCEEMIPAVARERLAVACDVFCEPGVFSVAETRTILETARRHGLALRLHADELDGAGGAELAAELGAASADHLAGISERGIRALAASETVAVLLPATMVFLGTGRQAPARRLLDQGAAIALASDFNPGSSPTVSLPLVMTLGVSQLGLRHAEAVTAVTANAAAALGLAGDRGQIAPGFRADLALAAVSEWREMAYWMGVNHVTAVWTGGFACPLPTGPVSLTSHVQV
ncbi:MAG TPA: imidazolonepropionase [Gemmatimonadales bacterium]|nr:imidazolonepropionase [Gemmatimonadales bacterium]HYT83024.1 imidazolonepropionase [Gemmatimonadales bacterium]